MNEYSRLNRKILFLCDQKRECHGSPGCGLTCKHTADISHAKNGGIKDGKSSGGRFLRDSVNLDLWWEVERSE